MDGVLGGQMDGACLRRLQDLRDPQRWRQGGENDADSGRNTT